MSENKTHTIKGQAAILVFLLLIAIVAAVFWNWGFLQSYVPKILLPADFTTQLMLIFAFMLVLLMVYAVYSSKKPKIGHGPVSSVSMKIREMSVTRFHGTGSGSVVFESMLILLAALLAALVLFLVYIFTSKDSKGILAMPVED